jgi:hypothetical protein
VTAVSAATACPRHSDVPSTSVTARSYDEPRRHTAHQPSGSPGGGTGDDTGDGTHTASRPRHHRRMPWSNARPRSRRYGREHRAERERHMAALRRAGAGLCAERVCLKRSRVITPDMPLHLCHAPDGVTVLGLGHADCNTHEASVRARAKQTTRGRQHTTERSHLRW